MEHDVGVEIINPREAMSYEGMKLPYTSLQQFDKDIKTTDEAVYDKYDQLQNEKTSKNMVGIMSILGAVVFGGAAAFAIWGATEASNTGLLILAIVGAVAAVVFCLALAAKAWETYRAKGDIVEHMQKRYEDISKVNKITSQEQLNIEEKSTKNQLNSMYAMEKTTADAIAKMYGDQLRMLTTVSKGQWLDNKGIIYDKYRDFVSKKGDIDDKQIEQALFAIDGTDFGDLQFSLDQTRRNMGVNLRNGYFSS